jgi:hypothetical protein
VVAPRPLNLLAFEQSVPSTHMRERSRGQSTTEQANPRPH